MEEDFDDEIYIRIVHISQSECSNYALSEFVVVLWFTFKDLDQRLLSLTAYIDHRLCHCLSIHLSLFKKFG